MAKTISMRAAVRSYEDGRMFERLTEYCDRMNLQMTTFSVNGEVVISFTGHEQQLQELEEHLEKVGI